MSSLSDVIIIC